METLKLKADQIPAKANQLYVQLYCERKGNKEKETIQEAKNSWASLSFSEKKLFYKTVTNRNLLNYAHGLSKSELYLKEKPPNGFDTRLCIPDEELEMRETVTIDESYLAGRQSLLGENEFANDNTENDTRKTQEEESLETQPNGESSLCELNPANSSCNDTKLEDTSERHVNIGRSLNDPCLQNEVDEQQDVLERQSNTSRLQRDMVQLIEPSPPIVGLGKDLYEMIKEPGSVEWKDLDRKDKSHYHSAVRAIKREYIKKYTKYLESLSRQQLFDHYMKTLH